MNFKDHIREIEDFPVPGVNFKDITPLLLNPFASEVLLKEMVEKTKDLDIDRIVGIDSRGFIFGGMLAREMGLPFVLARKEGKLPGNVVSAAYQLEYGEAVVEIHEGHLGSGNRILIHDDLLATGGTASAVAKLVGDTGNQLVAFNFLIELDFLKGRERINNRGLIPVISHIHYNA